MATKTEIKTWSQCVDECEQEITCATQRKQRYEEMIVAGTRFTEVYNDVSIRVDVEDSKYVVTDCGKTDRRAVVVMRKTVNDEIYPAFVFCDDKLITLRTSTSCSKALEMVKEYVTTGKEV